MKIVICLKGGTKFDVDLKTSIVSFGKDKLVVTKLDPIHVDNGSDIISLPMDLVEAINL